MAVTVQDLDKAIARWNTRLKRAVNTIDKLQKRKKRLIVKAERELVIAPPGATRPKARQEPQPSPLVSPPPAAAPTPPALDLAIPDFLQAGKGDPVAEQIRAEQAELKKLKARGRIAKMKAKQSGELRKMPLTGKAALAAIRG